MPAVAPKQPSSGLFTKAKSKHKLVSSAIAERRRGRRHPLAGRETVFVYFCESPQTKTGCGGCCSRCLAGYCIFWQFVAYVFLFIASPDAFDCEEYAFSLDEFETPVGVEEVSNRERTHTTKFGIFLLLIVVGVNVSRDFIVAWNCFKWEGSKPYQKIGTLHLALASLAAVYGFIIIYGACNLLDALRDALALFFVNELGEAMYGVIGLCGCASATSWSDFFGESSFEFIGASSYYFFTSCSWKGHLVGWATFFLQCGILIRIIIQSSLESGVGFNWQTALSGYSRKGIFGCQQLTNETGVVSVEELSIFDRGTATGVLSIFVLLTFIAINVLDDLSRGFKCLRRCHLAAAFAFIFYTLLMFTATGIVIARASCKLLDAFKNALALLFVSDMDEHAYSLIKAVIPGWVERQAEYEVCGKAAAAVNAAKAAKEARAAKPRGASEPAGAPSAASVGASEGSAEDDAAATERDTNDGYALTAYQFLRFEGCSPTNSGWRFAACVAALQLSMVLTVLVWGIGHGDHVDCGGLELLTPCHFSCTGICSDADIGADQLGSLENSTVVYPCCRGPAWHECEYSYWQLRDYSSGEASSGELVPERLRIEVDMEDVLALGAGQLIHEAESPYRTAGTEVMWIVVVVGANTLLELHKASRCFLRRHYVLCALHIFFFVGASLSAALVARLSCTFLEAFLDALSLLFIFELDKQAYAILDELGLAHSFERQARVSEAMSRRLSEHSPPLVKDPQHQQGSEAVGAGQGTASGGGSDEGAQAKDAGESAGVEMPIAQPISQPAGAHDLPVAVPAVPVVVNAETPPRPHQCSTSVKQTSQII